MSFRHAPVLALFILTTTFTAVSASAQIITDERMWATITVQERTGTSSPWRWSADVILRSRDGVDALDTLTFRATVGYDVTARTSVWAGYVNSQTFPVAGGSVLEHRFFGQHLWSGRSRGGGLSFRTRFEQRDVENNSGPAWRVRHQIRYSHPFREGSRLYWVGADEILIHTNATTRYDRGFDQNRTDSRHRPSDRLVGARGSRLPEPVQSQRHRAEPAEPHRVGGRQRGLLRAGTRPPPRRGASAG